MENVIKARHCALLFAILSLTACGGGGGGGGTPPGGSQPTTPTADAFQSAGNVVLTMAAPSGVLANDPASTQVLNPGTRATTALGSVTIQADGSFTYTPALGVQNVVDTFSYLATGNVTVQVSVNLVERVWFVKNTFAGISDGTSTAPFVALADAATAADAGDTLFVYAGDETVNNQNAALTLLTGQKLIGEGTGLTIAGRSVIPAGARPLIGNGALNVPVLTLASGNEVAGIQFDANLNEAIFGNAIAGFNIHDNVILAPAREGIRILNPSGTGTIAANTITGAVGGREGIQISNTELANGNPLPNGTLPVTVVATVTITGNTISNIDATRRGIRVVLDGAGSNVKLAITANTIQDGGAEGIRLDTGPLGAAISAEVVGNTLTGNVGPVDFEAQTTGASTQCIELMNNGNATNTATFRFNNAGPAGNFRIFEAGNDTVAAKVGAFATSLQGECGIP